MKTFFCIVLAAAVLLQINPAVARQGESIVFDPQTGNYLITYYDSENEAFEKITFIPSTKIKPEFAVRLKLEQPGWVIRYGYTLSSGKGSQQDIIGFHFDPVSSVSTPLPDIPLDTPPAQAPVDVSKVMQISDEMWNAARYFETTPPWKAHLAYSLDQKSFRVAWITKVAAGMHPGGKADFGFNSRDLPGIILAEVSGYAPGSEDIPGEEYINDQDGGFGQQYYYLLTHNNVPRPVVVPAIAVPQPYDPAVLVERIQAQMHTWIGMKYLDATFSSQLDRYLTAAVDAFRHNQPRAAREDLEKIHDMLMREHRNLDMENGHADERDHDRDAKKPPITLLAARVLDFNVKYVIRRMEEKREGEGVDKR